MPEPFSRRRFLASTAAFGGLAALHPFSARADAGQAHLRIISTTDLHCHVYPYDYYADRPSDMVGLSRTASLIEQLRAEATNSMLVDNGDYLQGNPMGDYIAYDRGMAEGDLHPVIAAMNTLRYDVGTIGNHEFNYGVPFLDKVNAGANYPIVCANFARSLGATPREDALYLRPWALLPQTVIDGNGAVLHGLRIGFIGFLPPQVMLWDRNHLEGRFEVRGIVEAARAHVPALREAGADLVIALSHSGIEPGPDTELRENASLQLAAVEGIDAVVTGHQHRVWPAPDFTGAGLDPATGLIGGKPAVMAGFWGSHMGLIDLLITREGGRWRVLASEAEARPIYLRREDRTIEPLVGDYAPPLRATAASHEATLAYVRAEVGLTTAPLQSYFATVSDDPSVQLVNAAQTWYVEMLVEGTKWAGLPILSAAAPFKAGGRGGPEYYTDVPAGPIAIRNVADVYIYPNRLQVVEISGAEVREWLERSAGQFRRIEPGGAGQPLLNPDFPAYNFDVIDGVTYQIDVTQPSRYDTEGMLVDPDAHRILDLAYDGAPIDPEARFLVATNNYRAGGGGSFPGADGTTVVIAAPDTNRDVIVRYIVQQGAISPGADGNWSFAPAGGATVLYETSPAAATYLEDVRDRGLTIEPAGDAGDGFERYSITL
ncbi:MAG: bifunctional 2',3'-cyclic-nucleotide 2'-phosphodiesterase/3'-nucleotidase [Rhodobacteraceae bacterium]|nr:bifunctional 2',3'-cyclic-nucleotide 2'-phosphodiesterase/3'-nucleotidase [Paracoccaceae bacterium]